MMKKIFIFLLLFCMCRSILAEKIWLGMLGDDGVIAPMALYNENGWSHPWPYSGVPNKLWYATEDMFEELPDLSKIEDQIPINKYKTSLNNIPSQWLGETKSDIKNWYLYGKDEIGTRINVSNLKLYTSICGGASFGLLANYHETIRKYTTPLEEPQPRTDIGFIFSKPVKIIPINKHETLYDKKIISLLKENFKKNENRMFEKIIDEREKRKKIKYSYKMYIQDDIIKSDIVKNDIEINKYYSSDVSDLGWKIYYVALSRRYGSSVRDYSDTCNNIRYVQTWLKVKNNVIEIINNNEMYSDCDMKGSAFFDPSFILNIKNKSYVISEKMAWEYEVYSIHELKENTMMPVLDVGCI